MAIVAKTQSMDSTEELKNIPPVDTMCRWLVGDLLDWKPETDANWHRQAVVITGPWGIGKTALMLKYIQKQSINPSIAALSGGGWPAANQPEPFLEFPKHLLFRVSDEYSHNLIWIDSRLHDAAGVYDSLLSEDRSSESSAVVDQRCLFVDASQTIRFDPNHSTTSPAITAMSYDSIPDRNELDILVEIDILIPPKASRTVMGKIGERRKATLESAFADYNGPEYR